MIQLNVDAIQDLSTREAIKRLVEIFNLSPMMSGEWVFLEISTAVAVTDLKWPHRLGFRPKDAIIISKTGSATVTLNYDDFTASQISITTTAPTTIRLFVGSYRSN